MDLKDLGKVKDKSDLEKNIKSFCNEFGKDNVLIYLDEEICYLRQELVPSRASSEWPKAYIDKQKEKLELYERVMGDYNELFIKKNKEF
jgi:hypothetical protein